jgi:hypothetical protein
MGLYVLVSSRDVSYGTRWRSQSYIQWFAMDARSYPTVTHYNCQPYITIANNEAKTENTSRGHHTPSITREAYAESVQGA